MTPKKKAKTARDRYMVADFTPADRQRLVKYCQKKHISVSRFLAGVALDDVRGLRKQTSQQQEVTITLKIPAEQNAKLQIFAQRQHKSIEKFVQDVLLPTLQKGKTSFSSKTANLRYYLSPNEHLLLKRHLKSKNLSARTYVSYLALQALDRQDE